MNEQAKNLVRRVAASTVVAGAVAIGPVLAAGSASAETVNADRSSVLTNVTPEAGEFVPMINRSCCQHSTNTGCC